MPAIGVAPSPSRLSAVRPERPIAAGTTILPHWTNARLFRPGAGLTTIVVALALRRACLAFSIFFTCCFTARDFIRNRYSFKGRAWRRRLSGLPKMQFGVSLCMIEYKDDSRMTARTILLVDDDNDLREMLVEQLSLYEEFTVIQEASAGKGIQTARATTVDLLIMDVGLPDMDGREAVKLLRKGGFKAPIIMLTGHDTDSDTILGLEAGANDYVTKPFRFAVLLARVRAQLRQHEQSEDATFTVGPYLFKPSQKLLTTDDGQKIRLTEKEAAIIRYLYRADQKVVTRDVLLEEVWGYNSGVTTHTLETHVYRLRQKIERDPSNAEILVTENGGYKIIP